MKRTLFLTALLCVGPTGSYAIECNVSAKLEDCRQVIGCRTQELFDDDLGHFAGVEVSRTLKEGSGSLYDVVSFEVTYTLTAPDGSKIELQSDFVCTDYNRFR